MKKNIIKTYAIVLVIVLVICGLAYSVSYKPSIELATYDELTEIYGIGHEIATDIIQYCEMHEGVVVEDIDNIKGIGFKTVSLLKERWK